MKNMIFLVTDGSSLIHKGKYEASSACSIYINNENISDTAIYHDNSTNSFGELYAISMGLDKLSDIINDNEELNGYDIIILSDSDYVVKSLNEYIHSWIRQGFNKTWKSSKGEDVAYQNIFKYIWKTYNDGFGYHIKNSKIKICHMRGHIGEKITFDKAYAKFIKKNNLELSKETFKLFTDYNAHVDKLANDTRVNKISFYEKKGESLWVVEERNENKRNGKILILQRNRRKK